MRLNAEGAYLPRVEEGALASTREGRVAGVCPFFTTGLDEGTLVPEELSANAHHDPDVGYFRGVYAGHCREATFREQGSSGGLTNWLAVELLESGAVDGVIHVAPTAAEAAGGNLFEFTVSRSRTDVTRGAKSRYYPVEVSAAVRLIREQPGRYLFIGIPCFVKAIRLLARADPVVAERIRYCFALFCGHLKTKAFAEHAAWQLGIQPSELVAFDFRTKALDRPANRYAVTAVGNRDGEQISVTAPTHQLEGADWGQGFFKLKACDYCDDIVGETADVSFGDAWLPEYVADGHGTNILVTRNEALDALLRSAAAAGRVTLQPLPVSDVRRSQQSNYRHRRNDLAYRLWLADREQNWRPSKRVGASDATPPARQRVVELRMQLREASHHTFQLARKADQVGLFSDLMEGPLSRYKEALLAERATTVQPAGAKAMGKASAVTSLKSRTAQLRRRVADRAIRLLRPVLAPAKSAVVLPATSPGGIGDDAMVCALVGALRDAGFAKIGLVDWNNKCPRQFNASADEHIDLSTYFRHGDKADEVSRFLFLTRGYRHLFVIGADVLDGYYSEERTRLRLRLAELAARAGMQVTITGFSFNDAPKPSAKNSLRGLPAQVRLCVRDPVSLERVQRVTGRDAVPVADLAFLLKPSLPDDSELTQWLQDAQRGGHKVFGINAIFTSKFFSDRSERVQDDYLQLHRDLIAAIAHAHPDSRFLLIPHDYRPNGTGEGPLLETLEMTLDEPLRSRTLRLTREYSAAEIKWICGQLEFVLSSRMHLAIAAIGQGTPVFCFGYQGKFEGLFQLLGLPDLLGSMDAAPEQRSEIIEHVLALIRDGARTREEIVAKLPEIRVWSRRNIPL
jgi:coenzyme F420-reducing hydrogenase beta subunit/polysaccharide pyruvyl transferase WcaK-like protein